MKRNHSTACSSTDHSKSQRPTGDVSNTQTNKEPRSDPVSKTPTPALDGGWGWLCVLGCCIVHILMLGFEKSFGLVYLVLQEKFNSSASSTVLIASLITGMRLLLGPVGSALGNRFSIRKVVIVSGILYLISYVSSIDPPNVYTLYFTLGVLSASAGALSFGNSIIIVGQYFDKRRSRANALGSAGGGIGAFCCPFLVQVLLEEYGYYGEMLIVGALLFNITICGALYRPLEDNYANRKRRNFLRSEQRKSIDLSSAVCDVVWRCDSQGSMLLVLSGYNDFCVESDKLSRISLSQAGKTIPRHESEEILSIGDNTDSNSESHGHCNITEYGHANIESNTISNVRDNIETNIEGIGHSESTSDNIILHCYNDKNIKDACTSDNINTDRNIELDNNQSFVQNVDANVTEDAAMLYSSSQHCICYAKIKKWMPCLKINKSVLDISLLKDPTFLLFALSNTFTAVGNVAGVILLPALAKQMRYSGTQGALLLSVLGVADFVGRLSIGFLADMRCVKPHRQLMFAGFCFLMGLAFFLLPFSMNYVSSAVLTGLFGYSAGVVSSQRAIIAADLMGIQKYSSSIGLCLGFMGIGVLTGPFLAGALKDYFDTYDVSFIFSGSVIWLGTLFFILELLRQRIHMCKRCQNK